MMLSMWAAVHGVAESDTTERLHLHFSLSCIGEGNGNPLQCSCLENPRDGGAWWAAVTQSRTRLRRLSSSSCCRKEKVFSISDYSCEKELLVFPEQMRPMMRDPRSQKNV